MSFPLVSGSNYLPAHLELEVVLTGKQKHAAKLAGAPFPAGSPEFRWAPAWGQERWPEGGPRGRIGQWPRPRALLSAGSQASGFRLALWPLRRGGGLAPHDRPAGSARRSTARQGDVGRTRDEERSQGGLERATDVTESLCPQTMLGPRSQGSRMGGPPGAYSTAQGGQTHSHLAVPCGGSCGLHRPIPWWQALHAHVPQAPLT